MMTYDRMNPAEQVEWGGKAIDLLPETIAYLCAYRDIRLLRIGYDLNLLILRLQTIVEQAYPEALAAAVDD